MDFLGLLLDYFLNQNLVLEHQDYLDYFGISIHPMNQKDVILDLFEVENLAVENFLDKGKGKIITINRYSAGIF